MGESARIAGEYLASKYAGCVIEPRKAVLSCGRADAVRNDGRQHRYKQIDGYLYLATVVREQGMYTKGNLRNLGGLHGSPERDDKVVITKTPGWISHHVHLYQREEKDMAERYLRQGRTGAKETAMQKS